MNKTVLITGASSGIGLEFAQIFASKGDNLVLIARRKDLLEDFERKMKKKYGIIIHIISKDLSKQNAVHEIYHELSEKKIHVDYLINNAGFGDYGLLAHSDVEKQIQMINVNVLALTLLTRLLLPAMIKAKYGKVLNVASTAAFQPGPTMSVYFASKAYVLSFSEAIAHEVKNSGVSVTVLCPGATKTEFKDVADLGRSLLFKWNKVATAKDVAKFGYKRMMKGHTVVIHGLLNNILAQSVRFVPRKLVVAVARFKLKSK